MKTKLYPLTFEPILKEKIWGGQKLNNRFNKGKDAHAKVGESWEIADLEEGQSIVKEGALKGKELTEIIAENPEALLGLANAQIQLALIPEAKKSLKDLI